MLIERMKEWVGKCVYVNVTLSHCMDHAPLEYSARELIVTELQTPRIVVRASCGSWFLSFVARDVVAQRVGCSVCRVILNML